LVLFLVCLAYGVWATPTLLVSDFAVPREERWAWAGKGLAELAVEALAEQGVETVDRDMLAAVMQEHDLASMARSEQDRVRAGRLLGATMLMTASLEPLAGQRIAMRAKLMQVETLEQVGACAVEGDYTQELQAMIDKLAHALADAIDKQRTPPAAASPSASFVPEALAAFQRGLDACASGRAWRSENRGRRRQSRRQEVSGCRERPCGNQLSPFACLGQRGVRALAIKRCRPGAAGHGAYSGRSMGECAGAYGASVKDAFYFPRVVAERLKDLEDL
jgi:hypothetical protein